MARFTIWPVGIIELIGIGYISRPFHQHDGNTADSDSYDAT
jgi:hypothetical protein